MDERRKRESESEIDKGRMRDSRRKEVGKENVDTRDRGNRGGNDSGETEIAGKRGGRCEDNRDRRKQKDTQIR